MDCMLLILAAILVILVVTIIGGNRRRSILATQVAERARDAEIHMNELLKTQAEMQGRMQTMA
ncbi:DNA recombination protein RmuC, partial [Bartonella sp. M0193]|nr:DNA recombination protein RmuC [Bartonella sp. M0193]